MKYTEPYFGYSAQVVNILESYGWHIMAFFIILGIVYAILQPYIENYLKYRSDQAYAAKYHKDPDLVTARLATQQKLIDKLQENYNKDAENYTKKMEEKENKKRLEWLEKNEDTSARYRLGTGKSEDKPKSWKPEYNPLMGNSTRNYRPPKKSSCGKGGCG